MNFYIQSACPDNFEENYLGFKEIYGKIFLFSFPKKSVLTLCICTGVPKSISVGGENSLFIFLI